MESLKQILSTKNIILQGADILTQKGFTQVPNHLLTSREVSAGAKLAYAMLLKYAWQNNFCFPGQDKLAEDLGITRQSVNAHIKELEAKGFIDIKRRGQGKPNLYTLKLTTKRTR